MADKKQSVLKQLSDAVKNVTIQVVKSPITKDTIQSLEWNRTRAYNDYEENDMRKRTHTPFNRPQPTALDQDMDVLIGRRQGYVTASYSLVNARISVAHTDSIHTDSIQQFIKILPIDIQGTDAVGTIGVIKFWFHYQAVTAKYEPPDCYLAVKYDREWMRPTLFNLRPDMPSGLPVVFPEQTSILGACWNKTENITVNIPDYLPDDNRLFLPQHPDKQKILWKMRKDREHLPSLTISDIDNQFERGDIEKYAGNRLMTWMFILGYIEDNGTKLPHYSSTNELVGRSDEAGGIVLRMIDYEMVTLADMAKIIMPHIQADNAEDWVKLFDQQAGLMREKAAILDTFAQIAKMRLIDPADVD